MKMFKPDSRVIEACRRGDREAFRLLFEAYKDKVFSIALYYLRGDAATAEDITQEVFLRLFTKLEQYRSESEFTTWLYRLVANACIDELRKRKRFVFFGSPAEIEETIPQQPVKESWEQIEIHDSLQKAISEMKPDYRIIVLLRYFEDMSYDEMARVLGCSKGTVASRLNRCHKILSRKLSHLKDELLSGE